MSWATISWRSPGRAGTRSGLMSWPTISCPFTDSATRGDDFVNGRELRSNTNPPTPNRGKHMLDNLPAISTPARTLGEFACGLTFEHIPAAVLERAKLLILDALGCGIASTCGRRGSEYRASRSSPRSRTNCAPGCITGCRRSSRPKPGRHGSARNRPTWRDSRRCWAPTLPRA
jgi:hypothetical protein